MKMYWVESKVDAIACMLVALFFLGTWPAILTLLERRGRLPNIFILIIFLLICQAAIFIALTSGQMGDSKPNLPNFFTQLSQDSWPCILFAMAGRVFLSLGNLSTQYAWAFVGLSVAEVITSSIAVVTGTTLNYFLDDRINKATILFPGVGCFVVAVCLGSAVHSSNAADNAAKLRSVSYSNRNGSSSIEMFGHEQTISTKDGMKEMGNGNSEGEIAKVGTADSLVELENRRAIKVYGKSILIGLSISFFAGSCFSLFSLAFNLETNDQWHTMKKGVPHLVVYMAFFYFSISSFTVALDLNIKFLYHPVLGLPHSSLRAYLNDWNGRKLDFLDGFLCGLENGLQFMGGQAAGYAAADAVQALPLVSAFWGILLFGEYGRSSRRTYVLLTSMLFMFIVGRAYCTVGASEDMILGHQKHMLETI